jgi:hypothetical protein
MRENVSEIIQQHIAVHLGPHTAKMAIKMAAKKSVGVAPDAVRAGDVPKVIEELHPMLNVLLGRDKAQQTLDEIALACRGGRPALG